jgi:hypothetical protein
MGKLKLKLTEGEGLKLDSVVIRNEKDINKAVKRWKLKGLI